MDYYATLGINRNATDDEIRKAYKKQCMKHHPDRGGDEDKIKEINEAYATLKDPRLRAEYDNPAQTQFHFNSGNPFGNNFEDIFGQMFTQRARPNRNNNVTIQVDLSIQDVYNGKSLIAQFRLMNGQTETVQIDVPPGIRNGDTIAYKGMGDYSIRQLPRGDLLVKIKVLPNRDWSIDGPHLSTVKDINVFDLVLGKKLEIVSPSGKTLELNIPPGTQPGTVMRIPGYGLPDRKQGKSGDVRIQLKGKILKNTPNEILEILEKYRT